MDIQDIIIDKYTMQMNVKLRREGEFNDVMSEQYVIGGTSKFQIWALKNPIFNNILGNSQTNSTHITNLQVWIIVKFVNLTNNTPIYIKFSSRALHVKDMRISADSNWHLITDRCLSIFEFDVYFTVDIDNNSVNKLEILYNNNEETDFELRGDDGSVRVHKFMLAAISPVFQTMLQGDWTETRNGYILFEGMSKATLKDFKQYIYFNTLPPTVSKQILVIAMLYEIPDMETISIKNLIQNLKAENLSELLQYAITQKSDRLRKLILERVQKGFINVDQMKKKLSSK